MKYTRLGNTGTTVSKICLGCMSFGDKNLETVWQKWVLDETDSRIIVKQALEAGINFFDTANVYTAGTSEEYIGRALRDYAIRDEIVIATKVYSQVREGQNGKGLSRKAIMQEIDNSLRRLGMDYIDLYQVHRWDYHTPIEESMEALHDVVKSGKARYIGASSMFAWQFAKAQSIAAQNGWTKFVTMQNLYNLIYREEEREMVPLCIDQQIGLLPWSPLAKGRLTREPGTETKRSNHDIIGKSFFSLDNQSDLEIIHRVGKIAEKRGVTQAQIALAWVLGKPYITAPIVGFTQLSHLEDAIEALSIVLTDEELSYLEEAYTPHTVIGFS